MAGLLDALANMKRVDDVTSSKDEAPPVYLMDEIVEIVRSNAEASQQVADMIVRRIGYKSPVIKYKALRLIKHLCNKGCGHFQRAMQRNSNVIRELVHFKGEQDAFKGDVPNQRVRDMAQEAVEVLFNALPQAPPPTAHIQGRIQGFGSTSGAPAPTSYSSSSSSIASSNGTGGRVMVGFGSDGAYKPAGGPGNAPGPGAAAVRDAGNAIRDLGTGVGSFLRNTFAGETPERAGYLTASPNAAAAYSYGNSDSGRYSASHSRNPSGGSASTALYSGNSGAAAAASLSNMSGRGGSGGATGPRPVLTPASEVQVVDNICTPGGMRVAPDAADLRQFVENVSNLDGLKVAELLRAKMTSGSWQHLLRALTALEALLQQGMTVSCGEVAVMFQSDPEPVRNALQHSQPLVRERAAAVWPLLVNEAAPDIQLVTALQHQESQNDNGGKAVAGRGGAAAAASSVVDLLGDDLLGPSPTPASGTSQATTAGISDIFGGLALTAGAPQPAAPPPAVFDAFASAAYSPASAASAAALHTTPAAAPPALPAGASAATTPAAKPGQAVLDDFFASIGQPTAAAAPTFPAPHTLSQPAGFYTPAAASHGVGAAQQYHQSQQPQQQWAAPQVGSAAYPQGLSSGVVGHGAGAGGTQPFNLVIATPAHAMQHPPHLQAGHPPASQQQPQQQKAALGAFTGFDLPDVLPQPPAPQPANPSAVWVGNGFAAAPPSAMHSQYASSIQYPSGSTGPNSFGMPNSAGMHAPFSGTAINGAPSYSMGLPGSGSAASTFSLNPPGPTGSGAKPTWQPSSLKGPGAGQAISTATSGGADMFDFVKDAIKKL